MEGIGGASSNSRGMSRIMERNRRDRLQLRSDPVESIDVKAVQDSFHAAEVLAVGGCCFIKAVATA